MKKKPTIASVRRGIFELFDLSGEKATDCRVGSIDTKSKLRAYVHGGTLMNNRGLIVVTVPCKRVTEAKKIEALKALRTLMLSKLKSHITTYTTVLNEISGHP